MKKFITMKGNPLFLEGTQLRQTFIIDEDNDIIQFLNGDDKIVLSRQKFTEWLEREWIKEVEEKEFTKSDMFGWYSYVDYNSIGTPVLEDLFIGYLKEKE